MTALDTRPIRTFPARRGRVSGRHLDALDRLWPVYGVPVAAGPAAPLHAVTLFGRPLPLPQFEQLLAAA